MGSENFEIPQTYFSLISLTGNAQTTLLTVFETTRVTLLFSELVFGMHQPYAYQSNVFPLYGIMLDYQGASTFLK